jgi:hypothetical protein
MEYIRHNYDCFAFEMQFGLLEDKHNQCINITIKSLIEKHHLHIFY